MCVNVSACVCVRLCVCLRVVCVCDMYMCVQRQDESWGQQTEPIDGLLIVSMCALPLTPQPSHPPPRHTLHNYTSPEICQDFGWNSTEANVRTGGWDPALFLWLQFIRRGMQEDGRCPYSRPTHKHQITTDIMVHKRYTVSYIINTGSTIYLYHAAGITVCLVVISSP